MPSPASANPNGATERRSADLIQTEISVLSLIRDNKTACAGAVLAGLAFGFSAKYVAAALLILSMALGN